MAWLKGLSRLFSSPESRKDDGYWVRVRCDRCGEDLTTRVDLSNDLSFDYGNGGDNLMYYCRKMLVGSKGCFQRIEVELVFSRDRMLISQEISGGQFVDG